MVVNSTFIRFGTTLKESLVSLLFNVGGIATGAMIAASTGLLTQVPWAIMLYPAVLSMRGTIGGMFCGHFSTAIHLGNMKLGFRHNTDDFYDLLLSVFTINFIGVVCVWLVALPILYVSVGEFASSLLILVATAGLGSLIIFPTSTSIISIGCRRGLDPDIISYPVESTIADILITICYVVLLYFYIALGSIAFEIVAVFNILYVISVIVIAFIKRRSSIYVKMIRESLLALGICSIIVNVTGLLLLKVSVMIREVARIYAIYPAIINTVGGVGSIVGSISTTRLALGTMRSSFSSLREIFPEISGIYVSSVLMFILYSVASATIYQPVEPIACLRFAVLLLAVNALACSSVVVVAFSIAVVAYLKGLEPDTFVIPIESSLADSLTTAAVLVVLAIGSATNQPLV